MTDCTERSEGQEGMPGRLSMTDCTERSEGQEGMPGRLSMTQADTPVAVNQGWLNSVKWLTAGQEFR